MKLTYRGVSYQTEPTAIATKKTNIIAKFRGLSYQISQSIEPVNYSSYPLKYRGISYQKFPQKISPSHTPDRAIAIRTTTNSKIHLG